MTATDTIEKPKTSGPGHRPPPLRHMICKCQEAVEKGGKARCGAGVGGPIVWLNGAQRRAFTVCVVCRDLYDNKVPCQICGKV